LDDQAVAINSESLALALFDNRLSLVSRSERNKAGTLGLALVIEQDVYLAYIQILVLE